MHIVPTLAILSAITLANAAICLANAYLLFRRQRRLDSQRHQLVLNRWAEELTNIDPPAYPNPGIVFGAPLPPSTVVCTGGPGITAKELTDKLRASLPAYVDKAVSR